MGKQKKLYKLYTNPTQTLHSSDFPHVTKCIVCASNYTQTIHKLYIEAFKTLHERWGKPYTERYMEAFETLHKTERKPCTATARSLLRSAPK